MAYPASFIRQTMLWQLPDGEVANAGTSWSNGGDFSTLTDAEADALAVKALDFWSTLHTVYATGTKYLGCRLSLIGTSGAVRETKERIVTPIPGTSAEANLPTEVAIVVSLRTANAGRAGRGRFYLPAPVVGQVQASGRFDDGTADDFAAAAQAYLNSDVSTGLFSVVASQVATTLQPVEFVNVGDVFDCQRRRRNRIPETRFTYGVS